jgi:hypothetical protein
MSGSTAAHATPATATARRRVAHLRGLQIASAAERDPLPAQGPPALEW